MKTKERIMAACQFKSPDRTPAMFIDGGSLDSRTERPKFERIYRTRRCRSVTTFSQVHNVGVNSPSG